jgi:hypothetical protein
MCVCVCVCVSVCSLIYPASKARAPYYIVISGLSVPNTFFHTFEKARFSEKRVIELEMCVVISLQNFPETFLALRRTERGIIVNICRS